MNIGPEGQWGIVERWQEYEGERRVNLLRAVGIAGFYLVELANRYGLNLGFFELPSVAEVTPGFHRAVTAVVVAWLLTSTSVFVFLRSRIFPPALKFFSTGVDILCLTMILMIANGPKSPLLAAYFPLLCLASLRLSLPLIRFAAAGSALGYLVLLGEAKWFRPDLRVPRYHQCLFLFALVLAGVLLGQIVRRTRNMAADYAKRLGKAREKSV